MDDKKYGGLSNQELCMIYHRFLDSKKILDHHLDNNTLPLSGDKNIKVPEAAIQMFRKSDFYMTIERIVTKLEPIVELIHEVEPEVGKRYA